MGSPQEAPPEPTLRTFVIRGASGTLFLQIFSAGITFVVGIPLARSLGAQGLGHYVYAMSWLRLLAIPAVLGLGNLLVREVSALVTRKEWGPLAGLLGWSTRAVVLVAIPLSLLAALAAWLIDGCSATDQVVVFWICAPVLVAEALLVIRNSELRGLRSVVSAALPGMLVRPLLFAALIVLGILLLESGLTPAWAAGFQVASAFAALLVASALLRRNTPPETRSASPEVDPHQILRRAFPFLIIGALMAVQTHLSLLVLGSVQGKADAGVFSIAVRISGLLTFVLAAANAALAPVVAHFNVTGETERMQWVVTKIARAVFLLCLPLAAGLILFRDPLLRLFGNEFTDGRTALVLLCLAQMVNVGMGSVGVILSMTGHEKDVVWVLLASNAVNAGTAALLIPRYGVTGAAISTTLNLVLWNLLLAWRVRRRLGLNPTAVGRLRKRSDLG